jgi:DNA-binding transcriptional LysR family regulator
MSPLAKVDLNALLVFDAVARAGGFTAAAERLGVTKAKVSLQIGRLERTLGVTLFARTTRQVRLTEAGAALHAQRSASRISRACRRRSTRGQGSKPRCRARCA